MLYIKVSFLTALFAVSPFIFYQLWKFVAPGLYQKEKKYVFPFVLFTSIFFIGGAAFSYYVAYPFACRFFLDLGADFKAVITVDEFFGLTIKMLLGVGPRLRDADPDLLPGPDGHRHLQVDGQELQVRGAGHLRHRRRHHARRPTWSTR